MIEVAVVMHGVLRRFVPDGGDRMPRRVPEGTTIAELIEEIDAHHDVWCVALNGTVAKIGARLSDGDTVECFAPLEGG